MNEKQQYTLLEAHQEYAKQANRRVWELIDQTSLTTGEEDELILAANASLYHWKQVGGAIQSQRGYWLLSRVYVLLGRVQDALAGEIQLAREHLKAAEELGQAIQDNEDQKIFLEDLNSGDWYGIR